MSVSDRIRRIRKERRLTQTQLADMLNVSPQVVSNWERHYTDPSANDILQLARVFKVSTDYFYGLSKELKDRGLVSVTDDVRVPVIGSIRAGYPIERIEDIEGYELASASQLRGRNAFILVVKGSSMVADHIFDGDRVLVIAQEEAAPSDIAVVAVNGEEATLKRVKCIDDVCVLTPSNPSFEPMIYPAQDVHILGVVVEVRRTIKR